MDQKACEEKALQYEKEFADYLLSQGIHCEIADHNDYGLGCTWEHVIGAIPFTTTLSVSTDHDKRQVDTSFQTQYSDTWFSPDVLLSHIREAHEKKFACREQKVTEIEWMRFLVVAPSKIPSIRCNINEPPAWVKKQQYFHSFIREKCPEDVAKPEFAKAIFTKKHPVAKRHLAEMAKKEEGFRKQRAEWHAEHLRSQTEPPSEQDVACRDYEQKFKQTCDESGIACEVNECPPQGFAHNTIQLRATTDGPLLWKSVLRVFIELSQSEHALIGRLQIHVHWHGTDGPILYWNANEECDDEFGDALKQEKENAAADDSMSPPSPKRAKFCPENIAIQAAA